ncbi:putative metalloprotease CJM1_0395 family protein [Motiliproteus sediminis]|uniref:putative metalloprotease CJM1_0395 family protein n=1 Tax=Motiliproteus sediminis TaxID=1468178 RepID=UPI001AEFB6EF|nr:putative metalloprotease CJM1_0395 family protein [Motiliproteus sediminis]
MSESELAQVRELAARDREVRNHEAAHAAAGGGLAGSPTYSFTRGPDGRLYATGGEVSIDTSAVAGDPQATIDKARTVIQAATAPANPSPQDLRAAAQARALLADAQAELAQMRAEERREATAGEGAEESAAVRDGPSDFERQQIEAQQRAERREELNDAAAERLERTQESLQDFAEQLEDLNDRLADLQRQISSTGAISPERAIGALLDISV